MDNGSSKQKLTDAKQKKQHMIKRITREMEGCVRSVFWFRIAFPLEVVRV